MNLPSRHTGSSNRFKVVVLVLLMVVLVVPVVVVVVRIGSPSSGSSSRGRSTSISTHSSSSSSTPAWPNSPACRLGPARVFGSKPARAGSENFQDGSWVLRPARPFGTGFRHCTHTHTTREPEVLHRIPNFYPQLKAVHLLFQKLSGLADLRSCIF